MNWLQTIETEYKTLGKAISHHPELAGREHVYSSRTDSIEQEMNAFADYAAVYGVYVWVQKAVQRIIENIAPLPFGVVDDDGQVIDTHPMTQLFDNVNDAETPIDLWSAYFVHKYLGGEAFVEIVPTANGSKPAELWARRPDRVGVVPDAARLDYPRPLGFIYDGEDDEIVIDAAYMVQDAFYNPLSPWRGLAPIQAAREDITIDLFGQAYSKNFLKNSARPDFAIIAPQGITQTEKDNMLATFRRKHRGAENWHEPYVLEDGVTDIKAFSFAPKDIEWLEQRKYSRDAVGALFGVPDEIMGYGRDTYENFDTALTVFWTLTLRPIILRRDVIFTNHFQQNGWLRPNERLATDLTGVGILQEDKGPKVALAQQFWAMGVPFNTLDERLDLGIGPIPGGEKGYLAMGVQLAEAAQLPAQSPQDASDNPPAQADTPQVRAQPQVRVVERERLLLTDGAKDGAKRLIKRIIQDNQNAHLRAIRDGTDVEWPVYAGTGLDKWLGKEQAFAVEQELGIRFSRIAGDHDTVNAAHNALKTDESIARLLGVAGSDFFTLTFPSGQITPDAVKAMVLQLDPDDEDAEWRIRHSLEARSERNIRRELGAMFDELFPEGLEGLSEQAIAERIRAGARATQGVQDALTRAVVEASDLGVSVAVTQMEGVGLAFDWTLVNTRARDVALEHAGELITRVDQTTVEAVREATARWIENGEPLSALRKDLEPMFGRQRAEKIAVTETTNSFATANILSYRETGLVDREPKKRPTQDSHPKCRCWLVLEERKGKWVYVWKTANDERVCPICGNLHNTEQ